MAQQGSGASVVALLPTHARGCFALEVEILRRLGDVGAAERACLAVVRLQQKTISVTTTTVGPVAGEYAKALRGDVRKV